jgi:hypothetical protein
MDTAATFANKSVLQWIPLSIDATKRALMYSITDGYIYGNFNYSVACTLLVPCWYALDESNFGQIFVAEIWTFFTPQNICLDNYGQKN